MCSVAPPAGVFLQSMVRNIPHFILSYLVHSQRQVIFFSLSKSKKELSEVPAPAPCSICNKFAQFIAAEPQTVRTWAKLSWAFCCKQYTMGWEGFSAQSERTSGGCFTGGLTAPSLSHFYTCDLSSLFHLPLFRYELLRIVKEYCIMSSPKKDLPTDGSWY